MANTIYIDWKERIVITSASELEKLIEKHIEELESEITFDNWLDENYFASDVFDMDEEKKREVQDEYEERLRDEALFYVTEKLTPYEIPEHIKIDLENYY